MALAYRLQLATGCASGDCREHVVTVVSLGRLRSQYSDYAYRIYRSMMRLESNGKLWTAEALLGHPHRMSEGLINAAELFVRDC